MPRYLLLSLFLVLPLAQAAPAPDDKAHNLAYSLGASLGERLKQEVPDLQIDALVKGLQQAYQGKPLALSDERIEQILTEHEAQASEQDGPPKTEVALSAENTFLAQQKNLPGTRELGHGILLTERVPGTGTKPAVNGKVQVRYVGRLPDGTVFDQNDQPQWFRLDSVIEGWRNALVHMPVGAKWRLVIPSAQAYGTQGAGDLIAPFTPLVFEIELLAVSD